MWTITCLTLVKKTNSTGEASVKLCDEDGTTLVLNKFIIDTSDGSEPVGIVKRDGVPVVTGQLADALKAEILELFQDVLKDQEPGIYQADADGIDKI